MPDSANPSVKGLDTLRRFVGRSRRLVVLTGAGCSTESGIPDYRARDGSWKRREPMRFGEFVHSAAARQRYWARSYAGWPRFAASRPNRAHAALARLESTGGIHQLITQNVDELHQAAGSRRVIDLHGRLSNVVCLDCGHELPRTALQEKLRGLNPGWQATIERLAPDGDANLDAAASHRFEVANCPACGGLLKPDVVFFGESVPRDRVAIAMESLENADALLVVGSSLMVWSGYRFTRTAAKLGKPIAIVNIGKTRADEVSRLKVEASCGEVLEYVAG